MEAVRNGAPPQWKSWQNPTPHQDVLADPQDADLKYCSTIEVLVRAKHRGVHEELHKDVESDEQQKPQAQNGRQHTVQKEPARKGRALSAFNNITHIQINFPASNKQRDGDNYFKLLSRFLTLMIDTGEQLYLLFVTLRD